MDMEMILLFGIGVCFFAVVYGIVRIIKLVMEQRAYAKQREEEAQRIAIEETRKWRESLKTKAVEKPLHKESPSDLAYMRESNMITPRQHREALAAQRPSYVPSPTQSVKSDDGFIDGMMTGYLVNSLIDSISHKSGGSNPIDFPKEERSVGVRQSETSWGFDDSDSRKSISSSMDTSSSSDSWSSSSSDSGPSSDW
jgi:hypothetical protein